MKREVIDVDDLLVENDGQVQPEVPADEEQATPSVEVIEVSRAGESLVTRIKKLDEQRTQRREVKVSEVKDRLKPHMDEARKVNREMRRLKGEVGDELTKLEAVDWVSLKARFAGRPVSRLLWHGERALNECMSLLQVGERMYERIVKRFESIGVEVLKTQPNLPVEIVADIEAYKTHPNGFRRYFESLREHILDLDRALAVEEANDEVKTIERPLAPEPMQTQAVM